MKQRRIVDAAQRRAEIMVATLFLMETHPYSSKQETNR